MCVGQYSRLRVDVVVVTPFYTLACVLSSYFLPVALQIIICRVPLVLGGLLEYLPLILDAVGLAVHIIVTAQSAVKSGCAEFVFFA